MAKILSSAFALLVMAFALVVSGVMPNTAFAVSDEEAVTYLRSNPAALVTVNKVGTTSNLIQTMAVSSTATTTSGSDTIMDADSLIVKFGTRNYYKKNSGAAYVGYLHTSIGWGGPLLVSTNPDAVAYYSDYNNETMKYSGSLTYNGVLFYYSSYGQWWSGYPEDASGLGRKVYSVSASEGKAAVAEAAKLLLDDVYSKSSTKDTLIVSLSNLDGVRQS